MDIIDSMSLLEKSVLDTLKTAIGKRLLEVTYCCLKNEATEDDISDSEFYLGGEIRLRFNLDYIVWVIWDENAGWKQAFSVSALTKRTFKEEALSCFDATS